MAQITFAKLLNRLVGERLHDLRRAAAPKPLTQSELARRTGGELSRSSVASIERGLQGVSLAQLYVLAQALDVEPAALLPARHQVIQPTVNALESLGATLGKDDRAWIERVRQPARAKKGGGDA